MKQTAAIILISFIFTALFLSVTLTSQTFAKSAKDSKARRDIDRAIGRAVEGKFSTVKTVNITTNTVPNESLTVYNKSSSGSLPPIRPPGPQVTPPPVIPTSGFKICMVGDFKDSKVFDAMTTHGCNYRIAVGDMGYADDLDLLKEIAPDRCVIGNHDSPEDGNDKIYKEALAYCGDAWWTKIGTTTLLIGLNTNGDSTAQLAALEQLLAQNSNVNTVIVVSHKGGHVPPNSHHPAEASKLYQQVEQLVPQPMKLIEVFGHNHVSSSAPSENWYQAGAGGKSFYACGVNQDWTSCNNKVVAYLQATIGDDGSITVNFLDISGKIIF